MFGDDVTHRHLDHAQWCGVLGLHCWALRRGYLAADRHSVPSQLQPSWPRALPVAANDDVERKLGP